MVEYWGTNMTTFFNDRVPWRERASKLMMISGTLLLIFLSAGCVTPGIPRHEAFSPVPPAARAALREQWGIEVTGLHLSAQGHMIDFRYRVLDPDKASVLADRKVKPSLTDLATGAVLHVPSFPKTGSMRQTGVRVKPGRICFMLFANHGMPVRTGSLVNITAGDFLAEGLTVQ